MEHEVKQPDAIGSVVPTLNKYGFMLTTIDEFVQQFVAFGPTAPGPLLDVGAAYGIATLSAVANGAREVYANDLDERHLQILLSKLAEQDRSKLKVVPGRFPEDLSFPEESLGAILIARVLHFFPGPKIEEAIRTAYKWLHQGGKIFITAETPYLRPWLKLIPVYEERKKKGDMWPGTVEDSALYQDPRYLVNHPKFMHFLDPDVLRRVVEGAGFRVEKANTFGRPDWSAEYQLEGRESCGIIGVKD